MCSRSAVGPDDRLLTLQTSPLPPVGPRARAGDLPHCRQAISTASPYICPQSATGAELFVTVPAGAGTNFRLRPSGRERPCSGACIGRGKADCEIRPSPAASKKLLFCPAGRTDRICPARGIFQNILWDHYTTKSSVCQSGPKSNQHARHGASPPQGRRPRISAPAQADSGSSVRKYRRFLPKPDLMAAAQGSGTPTDCPCCSDSR